MDPQHAHGERLAKLETSHDQLKERLDVLHTGQEKILAELTKYKGAIGFGTFLVSVLMSALILSKDWLAGHLK